MSFVKKALVCFALVSSFSAGLFGAGKEADKGGKAASASASASECSFNITGNDAMKFGILVNGKEEPLTELKIPEKCRAQDIKFTLTHVGKLPKAAMGHNLVVGEAAKQQAIVDQGTKAGPAAGYVPAKAEGMLGATTTIGGGEKTELTIPKGSFKDNVAYSYVCTFPGHFALMNGKITFVK